MSTYHNMKQYKAFSLVELLISLIVISLVAAAFMPVITKKLSSSSVTILGKNVKCALGSFLENNECTICPSGYYCPDGNTKVQCPNGYVSNPASTSESDCQVAFTKAEFTTSTTWSVPIGVEKIRLTLIGGGSGGENGTSKTTSKEYRNAGNYEFDATGVDKIDFVMCGAGGNPGGKGGYISKTNVPTDKLKDDKNIIKFYIGNSGTCTATIKTGSGGLGGNGGSDQGGWDFTENGVSGTKAQSICGGSGGASGGAKGGDATAFYAKYNEAGYFAPGGGGDGGEAWPENFIYNYEYHTKCHLGGGGGGGGGYGGGNGGNGAIATVNSCNTVSRTSGGNGTGASSSTVFGDGFCNSKMSGAMNISYTISKGGNGGASGKIYVYETSVVSGTNLTINIGKGASAENQGEKTEVIFGKDFSISSDLGTAKAGNSALGSSGGSGAVANNGYRDLCTSATAGQDANGNGCGGGGGSYPNNGGKGSNGYVLIEKI